MDIVRWVCLFNILFKLLNKILLIIVTLLGLEEALLNIKLRILYILVLIEPLLKLGQLRNIGYIPNIRNDYEKRIRERSLDFGTR